MASGGKHTPPKKYKSIHIGTSSCCTLCKSTGEIHFKNLFAKANRVLLITAEDILGKSLEKGECHIYCVDQVRGDSTTSGLLKPLSSSLKARSKE